MATPMSITGRTQKVLSAFALTLIVTLLVVHLFDIAGRRAQGQSGVARAGFAAVASQQNQDDPFSGSYPGASGRLLWQRRHPLQQVSCTIDPRAHFASRYQLASYERIGPDGRPVRGSYLARLVTLDPGETTVC